jgi:uncharacterized membrane protein
MAPGARQRVLFLDGLRALAIILMVVNHTARWWLDRSLGWPRYHLIYLTVPLAAPLFLFLAGFCVPLAYMQATEDRGERFLTILARYVRRGAWLVVGGWLLNLLVFPATPLFEGEVLQTIGVSIAVLTALAPALRRPLARGLAAAIAVAWYATFHQAQPALVAWLKGHPVVSEVWFTGFPLWPWFAFPLLGAVLGWTWAERHRRGADDRVYWGALLVAGVACLAAFLALELRLGEAPWHFSNLRDLGVNGHWNPGAVSCLLILGFTFLALALVHQVMDVWGWRPRWLVVLGQSSLMLYFVHQVIALTLVRRHLGIVLTSWWLFALADVALLALCVGLGWLWPELTRRAHAALGGLRHRPAAEAS